MAFVSRMFEESHAPQTVQNAAMALLGLGIIGVINTTLGLLGGDPRVLRGLLDAGAYFLCAWGLLQLKAWAWWASVIVIGFKMALLLVTLFGLFVFAANDTAAIGSWLLRVVELVGLIGLFTTLLSFAFFGVVLYFLVSPTSRAAFGIFGRRY